VKRLLGLLRHPWVRLGFVLVAVAAAVVAVVTERAAIAHALRELSPGTVLVAAALGVPYLVCTLGSWRAILADLGSPLTRSEAITVFGVSQLGKYVPGGVWNVVAAAELGAERSIPRRRSLSAMAVAILVALVTGVALGVVTVATVGEGDLDLRWLWVAAPLLLAAMVPAVLNRLLALAMRVARRPPLEQPLTANGAARAVAWALASWVVIGAQVWLLAGGLGLPLTAGTFLRCVGAFALAWVVGFLVVVVPAGLGAREVVLAAMLGGVLEPAAVIVVVLASRVLQTIGDLALAALGGALARRGGRVGAIVRDAAEDPGDTV